MPRGIIPRDLGQVSAALGAVPFIFRKQTVAGTTTYQLFPNGAPFPVRILKFEGSMTGAGAGGMTVQLQDGSGNAISNNISLAALLNKDTFDAASLDSTKWDIARGSNLKIVTDSTALCRLTVWMEKVE